MLNVAIANFTDLHHKLVELWRAGVGLMQSLPLPIYLTQDLRAVQANPRLLPEREHLPQRDAEHPRVASVRELALLQ